MGRKLSKWFLSAMLGVGAAILGLVPAAYALEYSPIETNDGLRIVAVTGDFLPAEQLEPFLKLVTEHRPEVVTFQSGGGSVDTAMRLGRMIRVLNLNTIQLRSMECSSACALAFLGGKLRAAESGAIGVHRSSFADTSGFSTEDAVAAIQRGTAVVMSYISEMGADPGLLQLALQYDSSDMRYLSTSEMRQHRVTNVDDDDLPPVAHGHTPTSPSPPPVARIPPPQVADTTADRFTIPQARSGRVRHPKGAVYLKALASETSANLVQMRNGQTIEIVGNDGRWYRVQTAHGVGYMHDTWVLVDQFESGDFNARHIQIKSFNNYAEAESFIRGSGARLSAYLSTNGWFAITLEDTFDPEIGKEVVRQLKAQNLVPDDAYMSYGNTYARKVCCDW